MRARLHKFTDRGTRRYFAGIHQRLAALLVPQRRYLLGVPQPRANAPLVATGGEIDRAQRANAFPCVSKFQAQVLPEHGVILAQAQRVGVCAAVGVVTIFVASYYTGGGL